MGTIEVIVPTCCADDGDWSSWGGKVSKNGSTGAEKLMEWMY